MPRNLPALFRVPMGKLARTGQSDGPRWRSHRAMWLPCVGSHLAMSFRQPRVWIRVQRSARYLAPALLVAFVGIALRAGSFQTTGELMYVAGIVYRVVLRFALSVGDGNRCDESHHGSRASAQDGQDQLRLLRHPRSLYRERPVLAACTEWC
jgi:hypothetical protein